MSYSSSDKLPKNFFQNTIEEKVEMIRKYLKDMGDPLGIFYTYWTKYGHIQILFSPKGGFSKTSFYIFKFRGPTRSILFFVGLVKLCIKGGVNIIKGVN